MVVPIRAVERSALERYLDSQPVSVQVQHTLDLDAQFSRDGQKLVHEYVPAKPPELTTGSVQTKLFAPQKFFRYEDARVFALERGFMQANAWVLAAVCRKAPELQRHYALLAFGTLIDVDCLRHVYCCTTTDFMSSGSTGDRTVRLVRTYGGFERRYAFLGMKY